MENQPVIVITYTGQALGPHKPYDVSIESDAGTVRFVGSYASEDEAWDAADGEQDRTGYLIEYL